MRDGIVRVKNSEVSLCMMAYMAKSKAIKMGGRTNGQSAPVPKRMERSDFEPISTEDSNELAKANIQGE